MSVPTRILLFDLDAATADAAGTALAGRTDLAVESSRDPRALLVPGTAHADLVVLHLHRLQADPDFAARLRARPSCPALLVLVPHGVPAAGDETIHRGDERLEWPASAAALCARVESALRLSRLEADLRHEREQHRATRRARDLEIKKLLGDLLDVCRPGALGRGDQVADLARQIAARFEVPESFSADLEIAARYYALGGLASREEGEGSSPVGTEAWETAVAAGEILERIEGFGGAAEVVSSIYENWDGTGLPGHLLQGQIPLRSRILRAVIDYFAMIERTGDPPSEVVTILMEHKGTRYDPLVLVHLEGIVAGRAFAGGASDVRIIPIESLAAGMVLADDLYTASGIKLLSRGTRIAGAALESILRRHRAEPIHHGAAVRRIA